MNDVYLCSHLKKLAELLSGKKGFAYVNEKGKYVFGTKGIKSVVTKAIAIYLIVGIMERHEKKKKKKARRKRTKKADQ
jgi:hypothetical protein